MMTGKMIRSHVWLIAKSLVCLVPATAICPFPPVALRAQASGQSSTHSGTDPRARAIVERMRATYQAMRSFSAKVGTYYGIGLSTEIEIKRPNKVRITAYGTDRNVRAVCDGRNIYSYALNDPSRYAEVSAPKSSDAVFLAAVLSHSPAYFTASLLSAGRSLTFQTLTLEPAGDFDGVRVDRVRARFSPSGEGVAGVSAEAEMEIGKADHLLRQVTITFEQGGSKTTAMETLGSRVIKVNPDLPDSLFTFTPPPGAKRVETLDPDELYYDPGVRTGGNPAPLHTVDIRGHTVDLHQYEGRVVLLDYWATWCAPCLGELPNLRAAYTKYHRQGLDIISVSLDDHSTRARLPAFAKKHGMAWPQVCDGKGFDSPLATVYKLDAIPFTLLIGRDGKIAAVDPRGPDLEKAIRAALARK